MSATLKQLRHPDLYVPDILEDILLSLPVKSLKRFQGVSKTWTAFISHPYFIQKHLTHLMKSNNNSLNLLLETRPLRSICTSLKDLKEDDAAPIATRELAYPVMTPTSSVVIFGSVNGLICLEFDKTDIVLWNPSTGESKLLPQNTIVHHVHDHASVFYGFGYDSKSEDYKVMRGYFEIEFSSDGLSQYPKAIVEVFSLKSGSWRTQADYSDSAIEGQGCLVNETLNWVDYNVHAPLVRSFDLGEEKFSENIQCLCSIMRANSTFVGGILNIKNRLAVYSLTIDTFNEYKIWVKRNGGGHDSWTEVANVISDQFLTPVWISESGDEVLAIVGNIVAWYSPKEKRFTKATETLDYSFGATTYIETLVSPLTGSVAGESSGMAASTPAKEGGKEEVAVTIETTN
uniref:F-box protein CPR30-like isoform X2 n=1 Tax=Fragaria vesca subsp. vesca TaxID=101020 RepID=UPI0005CA49FD|nr:PREDICTED: F-box protein CPR30-like isoform X2 [Fragaria vesca subsp. vesca]